MSKIKDRIIKKIVIILVVMLTFSLVAIAVYAMATDNGRDSDSDLSGIDARVENGRVSGGGKGSQKNPEDILSYRINASPYFASGNAKGNLMIENPPENLHMMTVQIKLVENSHIVYKSGYILPYQYIRTTSLNETLENGVYPAIVYFSAYDAKSLQLIGVLEERITLYIGVKK